MAVLDFDNGVFWEQRRDTIHRNIAGPGHAQRMGAEPEEVIGRIYEVLKRRRSNGLIEGDNPETYLNRTIVTESRKCLRYELKPRLSIRGIPLVPIEAAVEPAGELRESGLRAIMAAEEIGDLCRAMDRLPPGDREIIRNYFGFEDGPKKTLSEIAEKRGVTSQPIAKGRDRAIVRLRRMLKHHGS